MRSPSSFLATLVITFFAFSAAQAGRWNGGGCGGWGARTPYDQLFDSEFIVEVTGNMGCVEQFTPRPNMTPGVRFDLYTEDQGVLRVHVGPVWFLKRENIQLEEGAEVQLKASLVSWEDQTILMAIELIQGDELLTLRAPNGYPLWATAESL